MTSVSLLGRKRGLRGFALKHLTKAQFAIPQQRQFPVPKWHSIQMSGGVVGSLAPPKTYESALEDWQIVAYVSPLVFRISVCSQPCLLTLPPVTENLALWQITTESFDGFLFAATVYGKRYRQAVKEAEKEAKQKQPSLFTESIETPPLETAPQTKSLYSHLYDLLYPPPDDVVDENLPEYRTLYDYQKEGVRFLLDREHALLADDMGLGKTAQCSIAIAILRKSERIGRTLVVCPRAVIQQWRAEALKWGSIHAAPVDGTRDERDLIWRYNPGVLLATPHIVERDLDIIHKQSFDLIVCDDVSMLKNPGTKITKAIRSIPRKRSWCLTGTPMENKPEDFTNVMEFVHAGLFSPAERTYAPTAFIVQQRIKRFFLRRTKHACLKDLPPKSVIDPLHLQMSAEQWDTYRAIEQHEWIAFQNSGVQTNKMHIFSIIIKLIQTCNYDVESGQSAKADSLTEQISAILAQDPNVKAIVFSRFVTTLRFLEKRLAHHKPQFYSGELNDRERDNTLERFRRTGRLLLMSTKSGARGINLQEANHVFHFDRTYNPMDAQQGEDRCWRLGQKREVFVNRYLQTGTIEERIDHILRRKKDLITEYVERLADDSDSGDKKLDDELEREINERWKIEELIEMLRPSAVP